MECTTKSASNDSHFRFLSSLARSLARFWAADDDNDNDDGYSRGKCAYTSPVTKGQKERPKVTQVLDGDQT